MPLVNQLNVLISGPSDVDHEISLIRSTINDWNSRFSRIQKTRFEHFHWKSDAVSEAGTDPQAILNKQIGNIDVYIGVMWARSGATTPRFSSGTIEEYWNAIESFKQGSLSHVAFYFKTADIPQKSLDIRQWSILQEFRHAISGMQFYQEFEAPGALQSFVERLLDKISTTVEADILPSHLVEVPMRRPQSALQAIQIDDEDDTGFIEASELFNEISERSKTFFDEMGEWLTQFSEAIRRQMQALEALSASSAELSERKPVVNQVAASMDTLADRIENRYRVVGEDVRRLPDVARKLMMLSLEFSPSLEEREEAAEALEAFADNAEGTRTQLEELILNMEATPRMTTAYNKARKRLSYLLKAVLADISDLAGPTRQLAAELRTA